MRTKHTAMQQSEASRQASSSFGAACLQTFQADGLFAMGQQALQIFGTGSLSALRLPQTLELLEGLRASLTAERLSPRTS